MTATRPTRAEIDLQALKHNLSLTRKLAGDAGVMAVVKAEAYGHGLVPISRILAGEGVDYLAVSFLEEGVELRREGIDTPVLVMGGLVDEQIELYLDHNLDITVSSVWKARQVDEIAAKRGINASVHLKIDTGMGRVGQQWHTANILFMEVSHLKHLNIKGLYTHFATADDDDTTLARMQLRRFNDVIETARGFGIDPPFIHAANSSALMRFTDKVRFTMVRPGIMLYGWSASRQLGYGFDLRPVMALKTSVVFVKRPPQGSTVGYGATWKSPGDRWIATLPIGYGDGYPRRAGNRAWVWLRGKRCPVVGRVSMDQITVDAGSEVYLGDEAVLFGMSEGKCISIWELCESIDAIPYEITCGLTARVPRVYL